MISALLLIIYTRFFIKYEESATPFLPRQVWLRRFEVSKGLMAELRFCALGRKYILICKMWSAVWNRTRADNDLMCYTIFTHHYVIISETACVPGHIYFSYFVFFAQIKYYDEFLYTIEKQTAVWSEFKTGSMML